MPTEDSEAFCAIARHQIVNARIKLAGNCISPADQTELWQVIDCIEALVKMRAQCFEAELEQIDRQLEQYLRRTP